MSWCEDNRVDYVFGLARNPALQAKVADALEQAKQEFERSGKAARVFQEFEHETVSGLSASQAAPKVLYEEIYCARGDMKSRIKEQFVLFADRVSASTMRANQLRLYLSVMGYTLMNGLRRLGLKASAVAGAQMGTIRLKLFKIGAMIQVTVRNVWVRMASSYPYQRLFGQVMGNLRQ